MGEVTLFAGMDMDRLTPVGALAPVAATLHMPSKIGVAKSYAIKTPTKKTPTIKTTKTTV